MTKISDLPVSDPDPNDPVKSVTLTFNATGTILPGTIPPTYVGNVIYSDNTQQWIPYKAVTAVTQDNAPPAVVRINNRVFTPKAFHYQPGPTESHFGMMVDIADLNGHCVEGRAHQFKVKARWYDGKITGRCDRCEATMEASNDPGGIAVSMAKSLGEKKEYLEVRDRKTVVTMIESIEKQLEDQLIATQVAITQLAISKKKIHDAWLAQLEID